MSPRTKLSKRALARYRCIDCGVNVVTVGEYYMLDPKIWGKQLGLGWDDNLCIGCLERRLGRKISMHDLISFPHYDWMQPTSVRLQHRMFGAVITKRPPYRLRKHAAVGGLSKADVRAIGEYGAREEAAGPQRDDRHVPSTSTERR